MKTLIYPFDKEFVPVLRHRSLLKDYDISGLVSPGGWGLTGKDGDLLESCSGIKVRNDFFNALSECDALLLVNSLQSANIDSLIAKKMNVAVSMGKKIICARNFSDEWRINIESAVKNGNIDFVPKCEDTEVKFIKKNEIYKIDTPIIFVMGTAQQCDKFEVQLALREELLKLGYNVSQIGSREYCGLLGFHSMPSFMYDHEFSESDKIILFNHFVKKIELTERPEIFIIGLPGGVFRFSDTLTNNFGMIAFEISQAVSPDYTILISMYEDYTKEYFSLISEEVEKRYGFSVDCHVISCTKVDWMSSENEKKLNFLTIGASVVTEKINDLSLQIQNLYNVYGGHGVNDIASNMIDKLSQNAYIKSI